MPPKFDPSEVKFGKTFIIIWMRLKSCVYKWYMNINGF